MGNIYKKTLFLPKSLLPMKGNIKLLEAQLLKYWQEIDLYELQKVNKTSGDFILHDGPPFANGPAHIGHSINKILKDILCRFANLYDYKVNFIPGWDCHGLPIESKVEELLEKDADRIKIRKEARKFASHWIEVQKEQFKDMAVNADWQNYYTTMSKKAEAVITKGFLKLVKKGYIYRGLKPMLWSTKERGSLASIDVMYKDDHVSSSIYVYFPLSSKSIVLDGIIIWTTTPWSLLGNQGIAFNESISYSLIKIQEKSCKTLIAQKLLQDFMNKTQYHIEILEEDFDVKELIKMKCTHPINELNKVDIPIFSSDHVSEKSGTGFVHIAPGHGFEDFDLGKKHGLSLLSIVSADGKIICDSPWFGKNWEKASSEIIDYLKEAEFLIFENKIQHSYPYSQRSRTPLIYRATKQWFISLQKNNLKENALKSVNQVEWLPEENITRIKAALHSAPDWCISRQRHWGIPLSLILNKKTEELLVDDEVFNKIVEIFKSESSDAWFERPLRDFLCGKYAEEDFKKVEDIMDVWFESGSTHLFVLNNKKADLYLEGSDQHRGWFQSSLLISLMNNNCQPYKKVLTHGFVLDEKGYKMSKSLGNIIAPSDLIEQYGRDIYRLYLAFFCDAFQDMKINCDIQVVVPIYRKFRNVLRYLLSYSTCNFTKPKNLSLLEISILHEMEELKEEIHLSWQKGNVHRIVRKLYEFCHDKISGTYLEIRKDVLYCEKDSTSKNAVIYVVNQLSNFLILHLAPFMPFTSEEAWQLQVNSVTDLSQVHNKNLSVHREIMKFDSKNIRHNQFEIYSQLIQLREKFYKESEEAKSQKILQLACNVISSKETETLLRESEMSLFLNNTYVTFNKEIHQAYKTIDWTFEGGKVQVILYEYKEKFCARCLLPRDIYINDICQRCSFFVNEH